MMETTPHIHEIPIPEATREALRVLRDKRDAALKEVRRLELSLCRIIRDSEVLETHTYLDLKLSLDLIHEKARWAMLLSDADRKRSWRDRIAAWWQTRRAR